ncbi:MAG: hypothetical protein Q7O04_06500, partial [Candidatus Omnitrophota bacterium]|nr:hypothetical protein [Candidatus Omnitrophota bacterium]
ARNAGYVGFYYAGAGSTSNYLTFGGHSVDDAMVVTMGGKVGIGTTSPGAVLDLGGTAGFKQYVYNGGVGNRAGFGIDSTGNSYEFAANFAYGTTDQGRFTINSYDGTTFRNKVTILGSGNVGIGTTGPGAVLDVQGASGIRLFYSSVPSYGSLTIMPYQVGRNYAEISTGATNEPLALQTRGGGNVGIGTAAPATKLHVLGGPLLLESGGANTYGQIKGYNNNNHFITMRGIVASDGSVTGGHQATWVEYLSPADSSTGWFFKDSSTAGYPIVARISKSESYFSGNVSIVGNLSVGGALSKASGSFMIDHPLDPANKILRHSFVESPDMKNIYDGVVVLDDNGEAIVTLPDYFEVLNRDFRYQLTSIGKPAQLFIKEEIKDNRFVIAGGEQGMRVSWQVTGTRKDAYAVKHPIIIEEEKGGKDLPKKGEYLAPDCFGEKE